MPDSISLVGLDKAAVLAALFNASHPQGLGFLHFDPTPMTVEKARTLLGSQLYFDYLEGRVMKVDLSRDELDPWGYDRDNGQGAAEAAIQTVRDGLAVDNDALRASSAEGTIKAAEAAKKMFGEKNSVSEVDGIKVFHLGLSDEAAELLGPKLDDVLGDKG